MTTASPRRNTRKALRGFGFYTLLAIVLVPFAFVFWYMITTSLKSPQDLTASKFQWFFTPTFDNYTQVFQQTDFAQFAMNSLFVGLGSVAIALILGLPAAYAIARYQAPKLALIILSSRITPGVTFLIPLFIIFSSLGWVDTYRALIIAHLLITLPMVTWLMIGFFEELPQEIIDSARVDGASAIRTFLQVILPITRGGIAAAAILAFIFSWNHFMFSVVLAGRTTRTLPVAVFEFMSYGQINWGAICAAATVMTIPVVVMGLFAQRNIVQGLAGGAVKG
ncbi:carbohydrate ABC transporter permease [Microbacterium sp.]|uniref:carbohydrate ABC transporter permease n=1 Tax=Microbacterium sp. TaxID=51671 RepID=UPI002D05D095|nr:carbohydrate ABC transporter permease [Microbacterium sp.]HWK76858.1 carbohydrate ABC transporter permease [Microbacterium sp.]